jgi:predicted enzyme related to lactoylglutathione lyase
MTLPDGPTTIGMVIYAKDVARVAGFYREVLSLGEVVVDEEFVILGAGQVELTIHRVPAHLAASIVVTVPPVVREDTPIKPVFHVADLDALRAVVFASGGGLFPKEAAWEHRGATVLDGCDPEGNRIQFRQVG